MSLETVEPIEPHADISSESSSKIKSALERSNEIVEKYGQELPPPRPELEVVSVVPVYHELDNDNFWRLLRSLSIQNSDKKSFEVFYVINQHVQRLSSIKNAISPNENVRTSRILDELTKCRESEDIESEILKSLVKLKKEISEWEKLVFSEAVRRKVQIYKVFCEYSKDEHEGKHFFPQGFARDIGALIALQRLNSIGKIRGGMIDFIDADCVLPPDYYSRIQEHLGDPSVNKILIPITPDIPESISNIKDSFLKLESLIKYLKLSFIKARYRYLVQSESNLMPLSSAPSLAVQAETFAKVGEYPSVLSSFSSEDFEFAKRVRDIHGDEGKNKKEGSPVRLYLSQRQTDSSTDGAIYKFLVDIPNKKPNLNGSYEDILTNRFFDNLTNLDEMLGEVIDKNNICSQDPRYRFIRSKWFKRENIRRTVSLNILRSILKKLPDDYNYKSNKLPENLNDRQKDFLISQSTITSSLSEIFSLLKKVSSDPRKLDFYFNQKEFNTSVSNKELVIKFLQKFLPEYFAEPSKEEIDYEKLFTSLKDSQINRAGELNYFSYVTIALAEYSQLPDNKLQMK